MKNKKKKPKGWTGRASGPWPPRSSDMTPLDFFSCGHVKTSVYSNSQPKNIIIIIN